MTHDTLQPPTTPLGHRATDAAKALPLTLVTGATGKTGRRVADRLQAQGFPVRRGSRSAALRFDWHDEATWPGALRGVARVYMAYAPDLAMPGVLELMTRFVESAKAHGVKRLVLLSGRGEEAAQACEQVVLTSGLEATVVRASWFMQNFSEGHFRDGLLGGVFPLPETQVDVEAFVDADDIADVAVAALTQAGHDGEVYEVTGPDLLSMGDAMAILSASMERPVQAVRMPAPAYRGLLVEHGMPHDFADFFTGLIQLTLSGHNAHASDGVRRALGRPPRSFAQFAADAAAAGAWATTGLTEGE